MPPALVPARRLLALLGLLAAMSTTWAPTAQAQVRRCTSADGGTIYTDRKCAEIDAVERVPRQQPGTPMAPYRGGCPRRIQDLIFEVTSAIDAHDANRLGAVYHWPGLSSRTGYAVMGRLDAIVQRPLVDITALRAAVPVVVAAQPSTDVPVPDPDYYPQLAARRPPVALRIDQTLGDSGASSRTTFGIRRHLDCWWITL
ncbi:MAG TPA: hypothetical protein VLK29_11715 [Luteimonas sp.]|nr:hypothetical protein [Luteimonas sp.]